MIQGYLLSLSKRKFLEREGGVRKLRTFDRMSRFRGVQDVRERPQPHCARAAITIYYLKQQLNY